jgi:hypothetical protein
MNVPSTRDYIPEELGHSLLYQSGKKRFVCNVTSPSKNLIFFDFRLYMASPCWANERPGISPQTRYYQFVKKEFATWLQNICKGFNAVYLTASI